MSTLVELNEKGELKLAFYTDKHYYFQALVYCFLHPQLTNIPIYNSLLPLPETDVFHSPFHPFCSTVNSAVKLLTIYDLIPIKYPHFFPEKDAMDKQLDSAFSQLVSPNSWGLCISECTKKDLIEHYPNINPKHILSIPLAADSEKFYPCNDPHIHNKYNISSTPYILSVCTIEPRKNIDFVVRGFIRLLEEKQITDLNLVLVGTKGWLYEHIFKEIENAPEHIDRIIFTGYVPDEDMAALYSGALAFVYMSLYEGFGLPPLEAMQCGTPVITSNTSSLPEVVGDGGLMLDPTDLEAFCAALYEIYSNPTYREELAQKALKRSKQFSWDTFAQKTIAAYELAMKEVYAEEEMPKPLEDKNAKAQQLTVIVDGVFFQSNKTGIARVWEALLQEWATTPHADQILVLDRAGTMPKISGIRSRTIAVHDYTKLEQDRQLLQQICTEEGANVFISSYYTTPLTTPSVFMVYDMIPEVLPMDLQHPMWQEKHHGIRHATAFVSISHNTAADLLRFFPDISPDVVTIAWPGVADIFSPANVEEIAVFNTKYGIDHPYFFLPGGRQGYKNAILFFRAFAQLPNKHQFEIVCTRKILEPEFVPYTQGITVHVLDLNDEELRIAYSGALALVYPSKYEGFGLPIIEAMACGCPVITSTSPATAETAGNAALLVDPQDVAQLREALIAIQQTELRNTLKIKGLQRKAQFSWQQMAKTVWTTMEKMAASHTPLPIRCAINQPPIQQALMQKQMEQAYQLATNRLCDTPTNGKAINDLSVVLMLQNKWEEAFVHIKNALIQDTKNKTIHFNLGYIYLGLRQYNNALQVFAALIQLSPNDIELLDAAIWLAAKLDYPSYQQELITKRYPLVQTKAENKQKTDSTFSVSFTLSFPQVMQWIQQGQVQTAIDFLSQTLTSGNSQEGNPYNDLGVILLGKQTARQKGLDYLKESVIRYPKDEKTLKNLISAYMLVDDYHNAALQARKLSGYKPKDIEAHLLLGFAYAKLGKPDKARWAWRKVLKLDPKNSLVIKLLMELPK